MHKLSANIFRALYHNNYENGNNNFVFSPASYLEMTHSLSLCLKENNLKEVLDALDIQENELLEYIRQFKSSLQLENYNCLFSANEYSGVLNYDVINQLNNFGADIKSFDSSNIEALVSEVNKIVNEKTHGKISDIISKKDVNPLLKFIILNCVYFKKDWLYEFDEKKHIEPFYGLQETKHVKFLTEQKYYNYYEDNYLDIVEIPYKDSSVCCYLFVPNEEHGLFDIVNRLEEHYDKINHVKSDIEVSITCPNFKIESTLDLINVTQIAGINNIFNWNQEWKLVDFSKLLNGAVMKVGLIRQKAYIDFSQKGTEAAAVTIGMIYVSGCYMGNFFPKIKYIRADKPFMYALADKNNKNIPLFIGICNQI